jgi:hypothetical protein
MTHSTKTGRYLAMLVVGLLPACDVPTRDKVAAPPPPPLEKAEVPLSKQEIAENSSQCGSKSRAQFTRDWKDGTEVTAEGRTRAEFASHYNVKLNTCFYLLTVASPGTLKRMLFDIGSGEQYGEFLGPAVVESPAAERPKACRLGGFYCASAGEWEVLVRPYMED